MPRAALRKVPAATPTPPVRRAALVARAVKVNLEDVLFGKWPETRPDV
jgi:hypothetical protein